MKKIFKRKPKPSRPAILPSGWFYLAWDGNRVVMNQRPMWNYEINDVLEEIMKRNLMESFKATGVLPSREELLKGLRDEKVKTKVKDFFDQNSKIPMAEVDFEIGIRFVLNFIKEPATQDVKDLHKKALQNKVSIGYIIDHYYTDHTA